MQTGAIYLSQGKEAWILINIGNMFNNKGFYSDAAQWLNNKAITS